MKQRCSYTYPFSMLFVRRALPLILQTTCSCCLVWVHVSRTLTKNLGACSLRWDSLQAVLAQSDRVEEAGQESGVCWLALSFFNALNHADAIKSWINTARHLDFSVFCLCGAFSCSQLSSLTVTLVTGAFCVIIVMQIHGWVLTDSSGVFICLSSHCSRWFSYNQLVNETFDVSRSFGLNYSQPR